jgi:hypothetical protein
MLFWERYGGAEGTSRAPSLKGNQNPGNGRQAGAGAGSAELCLPRTSTNPTRARHPPRNYSSAARAQQMRTMPSHAHRRFVLKPRRRNLGPISLSLSEVPIDVPPPPVRSPIFLKLLQAFHTTLDCTHPGLEIFLDRRMSRTGQRPRSYRHPHSRPSVSRMARILISTSTRSLDP